MNRTILALICLATLLTGCVVDGDTGGCSVSGAWKSDGEYLFVPHQTTNCIAISSVPELRGGLRIDSSSSMQVHVNVYNDQSKITASILPRLHQTGLDTLVIELRSGERKLFARESWEGPTIAESLDTYSHGYGDATWQLADGAPRIINAYPWFILFMMFIAWPIIAGLSKAQGETIGCGCLFLILCAFLPNIVGGLYGWTYQLIYGWWNPRLAAKCLIDVMIAIPSLFLLVVLGLLIEAIKSFKHNMASFGGLIRLILYLAFLLSDIISLILNLHLLVKALFDY